VREIIGLPQSAQPSKRMPVADQPAADEQDTRGADSRCDLDHAEEEPCHASVIGRRGAA
jgi:hypothetical protein